MAAQSEKTAAPMSAEEMLQEEKAVNPKAEKEPEETAQDPTEQIDLFEDGRKGIYDSLDGYNKQQAEKPPLFVKETLESAEPDQEKPVEPAGEDIQPTEPQQPEQEEPKVLSRAEFLEVFKDFRIKDKVAGEIVEAPVDEWIRGTGLERHYTKRLMEVSRKEQELLKRADQKPPVPSEEEIQERYDELYAESPFKANRYLEEIEKKKSDSSPSPEVDETVRARAAYEEFTGAYPDLSQEDWARMNDPNFWQKHQDVVASRDRKEWFPVFVLAYNHLQREKLEKERGSVREALSKKQQATADIIGRKKEGQVIRTAVAPRPEKPAPKKPVTNEDIRGSYIADLKRAARERMRLPE